MNNFPQQAGPIGVFDSGYGGLTILHGIRQLLPQYDYLYLGDNARAPYGPRSFEVVYQFTRQAVVGLPRYGGSSGHCAEACVQRGLCDGSCGQRPVEGGIVPEGAAAHYGAE